MSEGRKSWINLEESEGNAASHRNPNLLHVFHYTGSINRRRVYPSGYAVKKTTEIGSENDLFYVKHSERSDVLGVSPDVNVAIDFAYGLLAEEVRTLISSNPKVSIEFTENLRDSRESKLTEFLENSENVSEAVL